MRRLFPLDCMDKAFTSACFEQFRSSLEAHLKESDLRKFVIKQLSMQVIKISSKYSMSFLKNYHLYA